MDIRSDRRFRFDVDRATLWGALIRVDRYPEWWPWLREFEGTGFVEGDLWRCVVKPPLPYSLRFTVALVDVVDHDVVRVQIDGDITGWAELTMVDRDVGCELRLISELSPASRPLRVVARCARPVAAFGHDWVLDTGARQFRAVAFES
ncbi:hypothetical protein [Ilumatobacter sp.]|uniref:hypothetical protein n=1 Tax=Ilumatobacter sp. TaxID=1967498 RepID=UPI003C5A0274